MGTIRAFEDIEAWKGARELTRQVYALAGRLPFARDFGLKDQICRSAVSIMGNIAEGFESQTKGVLIRHLGIAKGSAGELRSHLYVALDLAYITKPEFETLSALSSKIIRQIARLKAYLESDPPHPRKPLR